MTAEVPPVRLFGDDDQSAAILLRWWADLSRRRGERAELRRASTPAEAIFCPAYHRLLGELRNAGHLPGASAAAGLAIVAALVAHVETNAPSGSFARQMAEPAGSQRGARVSGLRFRRLLAVPDREQLLPALVRALRLTGGRANVLEMARSAFFWGDAVRKRWAYDYYESAPKEA
ncbi:MAG: type I-E CRISPR-associated protein Cse2/CasB [Thermoanaerobaculia bacterium]